MSFRTSSLLGLALLVVAVAWPAIPQAATETRPVHPYYSSLRVQVGNGLPIPITFAPPPRGRVKPAGGVVGFVQQGTAGTGTPSGRSLQIAQTLLTNPAPRFVLPLFWANPNIFQINTSIPMYWPLASGTLSKGKRTGPTNVSFCAGDSVTTNYNPGCTGPGAGIINGRLIYTKTSNQFGGPMNGRLEGNVDLALIAAVPKRTTPLPCHYATDPPCVAIWADADPAQNGAGGNYFGFYNSTPGYTINPGLFNVIAGARGTILFMTPNGMGPGLGNAATSFGGPWTTGRMHIQVTAATPAETFTLTGSDTRVNGEGIISIVHGNIANRATSGPNANRGWVTLFVPEPGATLGAVGALLMLVTCHGLVRRRSR